jgi:hypothetical protein
MASAGPRPWAALLREPPPPWAALLREPPLAALAAAAAAAALEPVIRGAPRHVLLPTAAAAGRLLLRLLARGALLAVALLAALAAFKAARLAARIWRLFCRFDGGDAVADYAGAAITPDAFDHVRCAADSLPAAWAWQEECGGGFLQPLAEQGTLLAMRDGGCDIFLLGTCHVSPESAGDARRVIEALRPEAVVVELCAKRLPLMLRPSGAAAGLAPAAAPLWPQLAAALAVRGPPLLQTLLQALYSSLEGKLGVTAGAEFQAVRAALEAVRPHKRVQLVLGDVPIDKTLRAIWSSLSPLRRVRLVGALLRAVLWPDGIDAALIEELKRDDVLAALIGELRHEFPELLMPLIHGRNAHLARSIRFAARAALSQRVAAVAEEEEATAADAAEAEAPGDAETAWVAAAGSPGAPAAPAERARVVVVCGKAHLSGVIYNLAASGASECKEG